MKDMKKTAALLAAMALLGMGSASAAEAAPMYALKGITVTATRQAESLKDVPANVQVITEKDIKLRNVQTASDAVAMATGVSASNSVEGTVNLRGYSSKKHPRPCRWTADEYRMERRCRLEHDPCREYP